MPTTPVRERTMVALATQLDTIQEGSVVYPNNKTVDFWTTPSLVTRAPQWLPQYDQPLAHGSSATQLDAGPVVGVVRSSGSRLERNMHVAPAGAISAGFQHQQRIQIIGFVKATSTVLAGELVERLWQDCVECLLVDPTLGGLAMDSLPDPEGTLDTDDGAMEPLGYFAQDWLVVV